MEMKDDAGEVVTEEKIFEKLAKGEIALTRRRGHDDPEKQVHLRLLLHLPSIYSHFEFSF